MHHVCTKVAFDFSLCDHPENKIHDQAKVKEDSLPQETIPPSKVPGWARMVATVPSVMDSPMLGTSTSTVFQAAGVLEMQRTAGTQLAVVGRARRLKPTDGTPCRPGQEES